MFKMLKCVRLLLFLVCIWHVDAFDYKLVETFQSVLDDGETSEACQEVLQMYVANLQSDTDRWALKMLDATSKIPVGLLFSFNFGELGQFSQCLSTESADELIQGKYCLATISLDTLTGQTVDSETSILQERAYRTRETSRRLINFKDEDENNTTNSGLNLGITWAICLPSNCSDEDIEVIINNVVETSSITCQTKDDLSPPLTGGAIATIVILSLFAFLLVASTALDMYFQHIKTEPPHLILIAFSVYTNGSKLFSISKNSNELSCLNGIRFFSMMWVIIGHVFSMYVTVPVLNFADVLEWLGTLRSMMIVSGTLSVDSFFFLSGLLIVYSFMKAKYHGTKFNIFLFYLHRFLRLTPVLAVTILITANLLKYMGSGPVWGNINTFEETCQKYWWAPLLYVQNYVITNDNFCLAHSWYLSVDMQLYVLSPLVLLPLWKYPRVGVGLIFAGIATFIIVPFCIAYTSGMPALLTNFESEVPVTDYMRYYYIKTHARAAPWFIGLLLGYVLAKIKFQGKYKRLIVNKIIILGLWAACIAIILTCIFGGHGTLRGADYNIWESSFHIALVRPVWTICLAWVTFACATGIGGPVDWFLSLPIYQVLNRFTYSVYLIHYVLIFVYGYAFKAGIYFDEISIAYWFWGANMFSFALSVIWVLAFESPVVVLEKILFGGGGKRRDKVEQSEKKTDVASP